MKIFHWAAVQLLKGRAHTRYNHYLFWCACVPVKYLNLIEMILEFNELDSITYIVTIYNRKKEREGWSHIVHPLLQFVDLLLFAQTMHLPIIAMCPKWCPLCLLAIDKHTHTTPFSNKYTLTVDEKELISRDSENKPSVQRGTKQDFPWPCNLTHAHSLLPTHTEQ